MDPFIFEGINYKPVSASNCVVDSNPNVSGNITIPSQVTDYMTSTTYNVTSTINDAFMNNVLLTGIVLPPTLTIIGAGCFKNCTGLTSIYIPNTVTIIDAGAFEGSGLTSIVIPNQITTINDTTFYNCSSLLNATIPESVETIKNFAFAGCNVFLTVTFQHSFQKSLPSIEINLMPWFPHNASANYNSGVNYPSGTSASDYLKSKGFQYARKIVSLTNFSIPVQQIDNKPFTIKPPTSINPGSFTYTSSNTSVATVSGNTISLVKIGSTTITANQSQTDDYTAGTMSTLLIVTEAHCFLEGSQILCLVDNEEKYLPIESIRRGTLVKTSMSGYKSVDMIGHSKIYNPANNLRSKNRLFKCSKENYPELTDDLIITGCHSILVDCLSSEEQREQVIAVNGAAYGTENKYRFPACVDPRAVPYEKEGVFNVWHLALEHEDY